MTQVHQVTSNLTSLGIRVESVGVDPVEGGVIAWLAVEPGALGLLDAAETEAVCFEEVGRVLRRASATAATARSSCARTAWSPAASRRASLSARR